MSCPVVSGSLTHWLLYLANSVLCPFLLHPAPGRKHKHTNFKHHTPTTDPKSIKRRQQIIKKLERETVKAAKLVAKEAKAAIKAAAKAAKIAVKAAAKSTTKKAPTNKSKKRTAETADLDASKASLVSSPSAAQVQEKKKMKVVKKKKIKTKNLKVTVVGMKFRGGHIFSARDTISFIPDPHNVYDPNAIKVMVAQRHVAFVSKNNAYELHSCLSKVTGVEFKKNIVKRDNITACALKVVYAVE